MKVHGSPTYVIVYILTSGLLNLTHFSILNFYLCLLSILISFLLFEGRLIKTQLDKF